MAEAGVPGADGGDERGVAGDVGAPHAGQQDDAPHALAAEDGRVRREDLDLHAARGQDRALHRHHLHTGGREERSVWGGGGDRDSF